MFKKHQVTHHEKSSSVSESIHVKIDDSLVLRRGLLESAVVSTKMLASYVEFKKVRERKALLLQEFHALNLELRGMIKELHHTLPTIPLPKEHVAPPPSIKEVKPLAIKEPLIDPEIALLKKELEEIEHRLKGL